MKAALIYAAGALALFFEKCNRVADNHESSSVGPDGRPVDFVETLVMIQQGNMDIDLPDPDKNTGDWEELRHFLKSTTGISLAQVCSDRELAFIMVRGDIPFSVCKSPPEIWLPLVAQSVDTKRINARVAYDDLLSRITK